MESFPCTARVRCRQVDLAGDKRVDGVSLLQCPLFPADKLVSFPAPHSPGGLHKATDVFSAAKLKPPRWPNPAIGPEHQGNPRPRALQYRPAQPVAPTRTGVQGARMNAPLPWVVAPSSRRPAEAPAQGGVRSRTSNRCEFRRQSFLTRRPRPGARLTNVTTSPKPWAYRTGLLPNATSNERALPWWLRKRCHWSGSTL